MPSAGAFLREEAMRDLDQDAAAVAHLGIGADRAAMVEVVQDLEALLRRWRGVLRFFMSAMKPTPQESFSRAGIVEALRRGQAGIAHRQDGRGRHPAARRGLDVQVVTARRRSCQGPAHSRLAGSSHPGSNRAVGPAGPTCPERCSGGSSGPPDGIVRMPARRQCRLGGLGAVDRAPAPRGRPGLGSAERAPVPPAFCGRRVWYLVSFAWCESCQDNPRGRRRAAACPKWDSMAVLTHGDVARLQAVGTRGISKFFSTKVSSASGRAQSVAMFASSIRERLRRWQPP